MARSSVIHATRIATWVLAILLLAPLAQAVVVAPHHTFIDHRTRSGVIHLHNGGTEPEEVSISFVFAYPISDSAGNVRVQVFDAPGADEPSAAGWIRAYPRRMMVGPGETQAVRLLAQPPSDLADGEYWTRAVVAARGAQVPLETPDTAVKIGLTLETRTVVPVTYRKGHVTTGILMTGFDQAIEGDSVVARVGLRRTGNGAFLGTLHLRLVDGSGNPGAEVDRLVAVYHELTRRVAIPISDLPAGPYTLHVRVDTRRSDLDPQDVLPAQALQDSLKFQLP
jgi:hypothetical protein